MRRTKNQTRIAATRHAVSNAQQQRYAIATCFSEDVDSGYLKDGELALTAIVYADSAERALIRFKKQFTKDRFLDIEAFKYETEEAQQLVQMSLYIYNNTTNDDEPMTVSDLETSYAIMNERYKIRLKAKNKKMKEQVKAKAILAKIEKKVSGDSVTVSEQFYIEAKTALKKSISKLTKRENEITKKTVKKAKVEIKNKKTITAGTGGRIAAKKTVKKRLTKKKTVKKD